MQRSTTIVILFLHVLMVLPCDDNQMHEGECVEMKSQKLTQQQRRLQLFEEKLSAGDELHHTEEEASAPLQESDINVEDVNKSEEQRLESADYAALKLLKNLESRLLKLDDDMEKIKFGLLNLSILATGRYYFHEEVMVRWRHAKHLCERDGMRLAVINSKYEAEILFDAAPHLKEAYWLDATDIGHVPGEFYWPDGREVDRWWWDREHGQPNDFGEGNQTAVCLSHLHRGRLCDGSIAHHRAYFICETQNKCA